MYGRGGGLSTPTVADLNFADLNIPAHATYNPPGEPQRGKAMTDEAGRSRGVAGVVTGVEALEGAGFRVRRPFPTYALSDFDPFLLLDEMGPMQLGPGEAKGAPDHPHRGFETVTYMLSGRMEHRDSRGNAGHLGPGDVQWMTAGSGVVHSEMPERGFAERGGRLHGFQLWVNLPRADKMTRPRYQEIPSASIPSARSEDGRVSVRVIAGEAFGARAVIETRTPIMYLHFTIQPGGRVSQPVPADFNAFAYVVEGEGLFGPEAERGGDGQMVIFEPGGDLIELANADSSAAPLEVLLVGGVPLGEPVARYGPFVMNTREEINQAVEDYQSGRMGEIK
jgi:redox-sensitive bicupin YhaK (pirin superfamily)